MAQQPRRTDRSRRHDDRYLFLEALLSAREVLHISYVGRDVRDNSVRVPSVVVSELLDYVERGYAVGADGPGQAADLRQRLVVQHPLQPFSRRYFDGADARLGTAAGHWLGAARVRVGPLPRFVPELLPLPAPAEAGVALDQLVRFLRHPSRFFLQERLGLRLPDDEEPQPDEEPFDAAGLDRYSVHQWLQALLEGGCPRPRLEAWLRATGLVPPGTPGTLWIDEQMAVVQPFLARLERHRAAAGAILAESVEVDWGPGPGAPAAAPGGWCRVRGRLSPVRARGCVEARLGRLRAADWLAAWARHLALNVAAPPSVEPRTVLVAREATVELAPEPQAAALLADLLCLYCEGLRGPVPLFPESALNLVQKKHDLGAVTEAFTSERGAPGEGLDRAVRLVCRGVDPLGPDFVACAWRVVGPLAARASLVTAAGDR